MRPYVITVSRQFASMGRSIAQEMSRQLGIHFYDRDIVEETAKRMSVSPADVSVMEEGSGESYAKRMYPLGKGVRGIQNEIFNIQKNIILDLAKRESCIIVGRCADAILAEHGRLLSIYIYAPRAARLKNCVELLEMDEKVAKRTMEAVDKARDAYHKEYGNSRHIPFDKRHILLDSSRFGIEGSANLLVYAARQTFGES